MGYIDPDDHYRLTFEDDRRAGLEVVMTGLTVGEMLASMDNVEGLELAALVTRSQAELIAQADTIASKMRGAHDASVRQYVILAEHLVSWNVTTKTGEPVPTTLEGVLSQKVPLIRDILTAWRSAVAEVDAPLGTPSFDGELSLTGAGGELSIPMEPLSSNPTNSAPPSSSSGALSDSGAAPPSG